MKKCAKCGKQIKEGIMAYVGSYYHIKCYDELFEDNLTKSVIMEKVNEKRLNSRNSSNKHCMGKGTRSKNDKK